MIGQLGIAIYQCIIETQPYQLIKLFFIIIIWVITMLQFAPLHNRITNKDFDHKVLISLNKKNWSRTILWTLIFLLECIFI